MNKVFKPTLRKMKQMTMTKRGQATIFIIIGLILLLSTTIFVYYTTKSVEQEIGTPIPDEIDQTSFKAYVESCIDSTTEQIIQKIALQGAIYEPTFYITYKSNNIAYWCYGEDDNQCVNALNTKDDVADQIIYGLRNEITTCLDFVAFEQQGYEIEQETLDGTAIIADNSVDITVTYPIKIKNSNQEIVVESFHTSIETPIGHLVTIAQFIINEEATGSFDLHTWQQEHADVIIERAKPYPSTIYTISSSNNIQTPSVKLNVAVEGTNTVENVGETLLAKQETNYGCCYIENICYANTPSTVCEAKEGSYQTAPCECQEPQILETNTIEECPDGECNSCGSYKHGETWCEYDAAPGEGRDLPGSRHYVYSCFDGETYTDPCRDYREEICVQTDLGSKTKAVCRANRWQDCNTCTNEECCTNTAMRDCYWNEDLIPNQLETPTTACVPAVPPGNKFWEYNGIEICARANVEQTCTGLHCTQEWVDATAISCFSQSDCGNGYNVEEKFTERGFLNTDLKFDPDESIYKVQRIKPLTNLPLAIESQQQLLQTPVAEASDIFLQMITTAYQFINQWVDITVPNWMNPFTPSPKIEIMDVAICMPWEAPAGKESREYCDLCENNENGHECTEYRCHALGKQCVYEEVDGFPTCNARDQGKQIPFTLELDQSVMPISYKTEETTLQIEDTIYKGYKISPPLVAYKPFTIGVKTTEESVCHFDYTPRAEYFDAPMFMLGSVSYQKHHNMTMRVPPQVTIPQKLKDGLNLSTAEEIVHAIAEPKDLLKNYEEKFPAVFSTYKTVTGSDLEEEINPYVEKVLDLIGDVEESYPYYQNLSITLLDKFENGGYYLFISCEDRYGNEQEEEIFIEIDVAEQTIDTNPPAILKINPQNNALIARDASTTPVYLYADEPATCKYSNEQKPYNEMEYSFTCNNDPYDIVAVAGGSYECTTTLQTKEDTTIYLACADHPESSNSYLFTMQGSNSTGIDGQLYSESIPKNTENPLEEFAEYINVEEKNQKTKVSVSEYLLSDSDATVFNTTKENVTFTLFTDKEQECAVKQVIETPIGTTPFDCIKTTAENIHKGTFACTVPITISPLFVETNTTTNQITNTTDNTTTNTTAIVYTTTEYEITCSDGSTMNINEEPLLFSVFKSPSLEIVAISPQNNEETESDTAMTVTTSKAPETTCGYAEYGSVEYVRMTKGSDTIFTTTLHNMDEGYNTFIVYCKDGYGNIAEETVSFYVVE
jgi:hypothetical protein